MSPQWLTLTFHKPIERIAIRQIYRIIRTHADRNRARLILGTLLSMTPEVHEYEPRVTLRWLDA